MTDTPVLFERLRPRTDALADFGFTKRAGGYEWHGILPKTRLEITVWISRNGKVSAALRDTRSGGSYILHRVAGASGKFVGLVRKEYEETLARIAASCFEKDIFKSALAKQVIRYAREKYGDELEYLWKTFPDNAVLRRKDTGKWYAVLLVVSPPKLGLAGTQPTDILDIRAHPQEVQTLADGKHYFPGYHMNKQHWLTVRLDGGVPIGEIFSRIDDSYALAVK